jgi:hypothetical protein
LRGVLKTSVTQGRFCFVEIDSLAAQCSPIPSFIAGENARRWLEQPFQRGKTQRGPTERPITDEEGAAQHDPAAQRGVPPRHSGLERISRKEQEGEIENRELTELPFNEESQREDEE